MNLTDGLDSLAAGSSVFAFASFVLISFWAFRNEDIYGIPHALDLAILAAAMVGASAGFMWWNAAPARIFMGDTGSLALGTGMAALALATNTHLLAAHHRRVVRDGDAVSDHPGVQLPGIRHPGVPNGPHPSSLRAQGLAGDHGDHPLVDHDRFRHCGGFGPLLRRLRFRRGGRLSREPLLLVGFAVTNRAVCAQLVERGLPVVATDDAPDGQARIYAADLRVDLLEQPSSRRLDIPGGRGPGRCSHTGTARVPPLAQCGRHCGCARHL